MPKGTTPLITALLLAGLALTGCTAAPAEPTDQATVTMDEAKPAETTPAPLTAAPPTADSGDAQFLTYVREKLPANTVIPNATDEQLLAAGHAGCDLITAGANPDDMTVIEGEQRNNFGNYTDSGIIVSAAAMYLCG